jgi:hypothetical protein
MGKRNDVEHLGLMTLKQAVDYLGDGEGRGPSLETLRFFVHRLKLIPKYNLGRGRGRVYVKKADLDDLVAGGKSKAFRVIEGGRR